VDTDGNGLPDWWEAAWFGQPTGTDPAADPDQDGASNLQEFLADTIPTDPTSVLRLNSVSRGPNSTALGWSGGVQVRQYLQRTANPLNPAGWITVQTNQAPTPVEGIFLDNTATNAAGFYRIQVEKPW